MSRFFVLFFIMPIVSLVGKKIDQTQGFLEDGTRVPLSVISVANNVVSQVKTQEHEGYNALQLGFGITKRADKPTLGHIKKAGLEEKKPRFFREIRVDDTEEFTPGLQLSVSEILEVGDIVDVVGTSKGKGYAGVVKRHGFHGGPKTHGQSDRHRAPGASSTGTTPGRVYRGKRMAGRMGDERVTVKNLEILGIEGDTLFVKGLIPGSKGSIVMVNKVGKNKKFMPLWSEKPEVSENSEGQSVGESDTQNLEASKVATSEDTVKTPEEKVETAQDTVETPQAEAAKSNSTNKNENQEESKKEVTEDAAK